MFAALCTLVALAGCDDTGTEPEPLASIEVTLAAASIQAGSTTSATAQGRSSGGASIATGIVAWSSSSSSVATVNANGVITAAAAGTTQIIATVGSISAQQTLTVTPPPPVLTSVVVGAPGDTITVGQSITATASGRDQFGAPFAAGTITWSTSAASVATVSTAGEITAVSPGTASIVATAGGIAGQLALTVTAPPAIRINEVESNGGTPGDWVELFNPTASPVDLSGWALKDNDDSRTFRFAAGTTIAAGGYLVVEEATFDYGLGAGDAARLFNQFGAPVDSYSWTSHASTTYGRCPNGTGAFVTMSSVTKGAVNDCRPQIRVNEVESSGGTPGDWIELYNAGTTTVDLSGFIVKDNDDSRTTTLPTGAAIAPGAFFVIEESVLGFGLGSADAARIFDATGVLIDSYEWTSHATTTYGRCPDGSGAFASTTASTKGAANVCTPVGPTSAPWPGSDNTTTVDAAGFFGTNMSGLTFEGAAGGNPSVLWASKNGPGTLYRLLLAGGVWTPDPANGWANGKLLRYTDSLGDADAEGVAFAGGGSAAGIYIAAERNNAASGVSRISILRYDPSQTWTTLRATHEWNLTTGLPVVGANLGAEAITWIPDSVLVNRQFYDESKSRAYDPADYPDHGNGVFFIGLEANGIIYAYALNHVNSTYTRVATISTGFPGVMGLEYDPATRYLWAHCDDGCSTTQGVLEIDVAVGSPTRGRFLAPRRFARPSTLGNFNNEGFAFGTQAECVGGLKPVFWADDNQTGGHAIRSASMPCGPIASPGSLSRTRR